MSSNWERTSINEIKEVFDEFEFDVWEPVLLDPSFCGIQPSLFANLLSEWLGVDVLARNLTMNVSICDPARLGNSWKLASQSPDQIQLDDCQVLGQSAQVFQGGIEFVVGPFSRQDWPCWRDSQWFDECNAKIAAGIKLHSLSDYLLPLEIIRKWTVTVQHDPDQFVLQQSRLGSAHMRSETITTGASAFQSDL